MGNSLHGYMKIFSTIIALLIIALSAVMVAEEGDYGYVIAGKLAFAWMVVIGVWVLVDIVMLLAHAGYMKKDSRGVEMV